MVSGLFMIVVLILFAGWQAIGGGSQRMVLGSLAIAILSYLMMVAPRVTLRDEGVVVHNPWREIRIPWGRLDYVGSGWTLAFSADDRRHESFAITSQASFRSRTGQVEGGILGPPEPVGGEIAPGGRIRGRVTPGRAAAVIEQAQQEWLRGLGGEPGVMGEGEHTLARWHPMSLALTVTMIVFVVLAIVA